MLAAALIFVAVSPAASQPKKTAAQLRMNYYLEHPNDQDLVYAKRDARAAREAPEVAPLLRAAFERRWIKSSGPSTGITLEQFEALANECPPFGDDNEKLVDLLATPIAPGAWSDAAFRHFVAQKLPRRPSTVDRLLGAALPGAASAVVDRYVFMLEVLDDAARVRDHFTERALRRASPEAMATYHARLNELADQADLRRFHTRDESKHMRRVLGDALYEMGPGEWSRAGGALASLVKSSRQAAGSFLDKAAKHLRQQPGARNQANGGLLGALADLTTPGAALAQLQPAHDVGWFLWLHEARVLPQIHAAAERLGSSEPVRTSYRQLVNFVGEGNFRRLFPVVAHYYEKLPKQSFADLIRPRATGEDADLILPEARAGKYAAAHRERLARDILAAGGPLDRAWERASAPGTLELAIELYGGLVDMQQPIPVLSSHLASPLLAEIISGLVELFRRVPPPVETLLGLLDPLADHLQQCRERGVDTGGSAALRKLDTAIAADVVEAVDSLPSGAGGDGAMLPEHRELVRLFVQKLALALRVRSLVARALGRTPKWMVAARVGLRDRVFGLASHRGESVAYWSEDVTRFRARLLVELDQPLRQALAAHEAPDDARAFFEELYLPLVRVHGFLRALKQEAPAVWPHLAWARAGTHDQKLMVLRKVFAALHTDRWLDADEAVLDLAREHLASTHAKRNVWATPPEEVFAGRWSVNANLRIWKDMLAGAPAGAPTEWKLTQIAAKAVEELARGGVASGPRFPLDPARRPARDAFEPVWDYADWAENLVTAAEWQSAPFLDDHDRVLPWHERSEPRVRVESDAEERFRFQLQGDEVSRRVDGSTRRRLAAVLLDSLGHAGIATARTERREKLGRIARIAMFLPNHHDNLAASGESLAVYRSIREQVYQKLGAVTGTENLDEQRNVLRWMMRLHVSQRSTPPLEPSFDDVVARFEASSRDRPHWDMALRNVLSEKVELERILDRASGDDVVAARVYIDDQLAALRRCTIADAALCHRYFDAELDALDEERVFRLLKLRRRLRTLVARLPDPGEADPVVLAADLQRIGQALELIDDNVWFTRPDFNPAVYLEKPRTAEVGERGSGESRRWWPALVILAWHDAEQLAHVLEWSDAFATEPDGPAAKAIETIGRLAFSLNEAVLATVRTISESDAAEAMLDFRHEIPWSEINFRILAEARPREEASAESLSRGCFQGIATNLRLASTGRAPSDDELWERLFGSLDFALPVQWRRRSGTRLNVNLDEAVRLAAAWAERERLPQSLREGAATFLRGQDPALRPLLAGAETPGGLMRVFHELLRRSAKRSAAYGKFYVETLTKESRFAPDFTEALMTPFFTHDAPAQREHVQVLLAGWREHSTGEPASGSALVATYRRDFASVIDGLIRGHDRPEGGTYIWAPVDALRKEEGVMKTKPAAFMETAKWLLDLNAQYPEAELRRLFGQRENRA